MSPLRGYVYQRIFLTTFFRLRIYCHLALITYDATNRMNPSMGPLLIKIIPSSFPVKRFYMMYLFQINSSMSEEVYIPKVQGRRSNKRRVSVFRSVCCQVFGDS